MEALANGIELVFTTNCTISQMRKYARDPDLQKKIDTAYMQLDEKTRISYEELGLVPDDLIDMNRCVNELATLYRRVYVGKGE